MAVEEVKMRKNTSAEKNSFVGFFKDLKAEIKRITWAPKEEVKKTTLAVFTLTAIYIVYVTVLDGIFQKIYMSVFK